MTAELFDRWALELSIAILTAIAVLGINIWQNRSRIETVKTAVFGHENNGGGQSDKLSNISDSLDDIEDTLDRQEDVRKQEHTEVKNAVRENRRQMLHAFDQLITEINYQSGDIDVESSDLLEDIDDDVFRGRNPDET